jgi:hypothetical protein
MGEANSTLVPCLESAQNEACRIALYFAVGSTNQKGVFIEKCVFRNKWEDQQRKQACGREDKREKLSIDYSLIECFAKQVLTRHCINAPYHKFGGTLRDAEVLTSSRSEFVCRAKPALVYLTGLTQN